MSTTLYPNLIYGLFIPADENYLLDAIGLTIAHTYDGIDVETVEDAAKLLADQDGFEEVQYLKEVDIESLIYVSNPLHTDEWSEGLILPMAYDTFDNYYLRLVGDAKKLYGELLPKDFDYERHLGCIQFVTSG